MRYEQYAPTGFDAKGLGLHDRQDWRVAPCGRNRDSEPLAESNCATLLKMLGGESDTVEVHRFGHWACGWFEIILVNPADTKAIATLEDCERALENYPILDDEDCGRREDEAAAYIWSECYDWRERARYLREHSYTAQSGADVLAAVRGDWSAASNILHCPGDILG